MNVFRHNHVANQAKFISKADFVENVDKATACIWGSEQGTTPDAAKRDEVKVALSVPAL
jgi:hypothetical protein